ncbi:hypothetical protein [Bacteroides thetaiotaomicron]|uniref:hypothetical protein n=1 Tax=Bacteroides thetaiotaomicron TaxID=818 RepID=UPI0021669D08|nr:hypothetical protein [Bacteroides thetaiotaomicron]MCS3079956.1 hypothetical protein [Bacteroides thetaiotaomicron]
MMFAFSGDMNWKGLDFSSNSGCCLVTNSLSHRWGNDVEDNTPLTCPWYGGWDNAPLFFGRRFMASDNPPLNADYPRLSTSPISNNCLGSANWKKNGAFILRSKNVTLRHKLPKNGPKALDRNLLTHVSGGNFPYFLTEFKHP